jgi:hypothetical protein
MTLIKITEEMIHKELVDALNNNFEKLDKRFDSIDASLQNLTKILSEQTKSMNQYHKDNYAMRKEFSNINKRLVKLENKTRHL